MLTRRTRTVVSPSLALHEPAARMGLQSPSLGEQTQPPDNHFRPVSPSLIPELMPSPVATPCASPSLGLIPEAAMRRAAKMPIQTDAQGATRMTTAVCKRASRMARPSEPSESAQQLAEYLVSQAEAELRGQGFERQLLEELQVFKHQAASTGKGPAVRAGTGDADNDAAAQAMMNHMVSIKSRHVDTNNQEPPWLMDARNACPQMYGRLAANAIKRYTRHRATSLWTVPHTLHHPARAQ